MAISSRQLEQHEAFLLKKAFGLECKKCRYTLTRVLTSNSIDILVNHERGCEGPAKKRRFFSRFSRSGVPKKKAQKLKLI